MLVETFSYELPPELIAQRPSEERGGSRLLVLSPGDEAAPEPTPEHRRVAELAELLPAGALVVVNDTRVIPARLLGRKRDTGGHVEVLLVRRDDDQTVKTPQGDARLAQTWRALGKSSKPLRFGTDVEVLARGSEGGRSDLLIRLLGRADDGLLEVALWTSTGAPVDAELRACGHVPLPPYIKRIDEDVDDERYQTVYARHEGAVAAPTAGLHITNALLGRLALRGCDVASVTLHVGLGTFQPVQVEDFDDHVMHAERFSVSQSTAAAVARARAQGRPVVAVGTTTARALESAADPNRPGEVRPSRGETRLLITPGYAWRVVDGLVTNFHLPRSTLLAMVCSLGGTERVLGAYRIAVREQYKFYSYGDAMLVWRSR